MELIDKVRDFVQEHGMFSPGDKVLVAVSGGPDSVALLDILYRMRDELRIDLHVAHLDHQLRGDESTKDAQLVRELSSSLKIPCTIESRDVPGFLRTSRLSTEEGARTVRYGFLREVAERVGATKIATGHNLNDQAETVIFRLLRGSGAKGLGGIPPVRDGVFVRPLLRISRQEIQRYLARRRLPFREDLSNRDPHFTRNKIRLKLLPYLMGDYNPNILRVLDRTANLLRAEDDFLEGLVGEIFPGIIKNKWKNKIILDVPRLLGHHISVQRRMIRKALTYLSEDLEFNLVDDLLSLARSSSGALHISSQVTAQKCQDLLILRRGESPTFRTRVKVPGKTDIPQLGASLLTRILPKETASKNWEELAPNEAAFDLGSLGQGLELRSRKPGDTFQPHGMEGHKKVSDFLIDQKVPKILRDEIPLLVDERRIIWVVGMRASGECRVTEKTGRILWAEFHRWGESSDEDFLSSIP